MRRKEIRIMLAASFLVMIVLAGCYCYEVYLDYRVPVPYNGRVMAMPIVEDLGDSDTDQDRFYFDPPVIYCGQMQLFDPGRR